MEERVSDRRLAEFRDVLTILKTPPEDQTLVRVEQLDWVFDSIMWTAAGFRSVLKGSREGDAKAKNLLSRFSRDWNRVRDDRPAFAAFHEDIRQTADASDWVEQLRAAYDQHDSL